MKISREEIVKIIADIDPDWIKKNLKGFTLEKAIELADYISGVINGEKPEPTSRSIYKSTCLTSDLLISEMVIRDILLTIGVDGHIAVFSTCLADEINKDVPFIK